MIFNYETLWPRLKNDYKGLLTEYDVQRDSILELCFYIARRVAMYDEMIDMLTPEKITKVLDEASKEYFAEHDFSPELQAAIEQYFIDHPIDEEINNAIDKYLEGKDFSPQVEKAVEKYLAENPVEKEIVRQVFNEEIAKYIEQIASSIVIEDTQENVIAKDDWTTEYNDGTRFIVTDANYLYYLKQEDGKYKAILITAVHSVNGQTGDITLDAADVGAASTDDLDAVNQSISKLVTGVSSVNTKTGEVVLNAEDVGAAYIDGDGEAGPANKLNADTLQDKDVKGVLSSNVSDVSLNYTYLVCAGVFYDNTHCVFQITLPYNSDATSIKSVTVTGPIYIYGSQNAIVIDTAKITLARATPYLNLNIIPCQLTMDDNTLPINTAVIIVIQNIVINI